MNQKMNTNLKHTSRKGRAFCCGALTLITFTGFSLGTSGTVYAHSDQPVSDPGGNIAAFCSSTGGW